MVKPYFETELGKLYCGSASDVLQTLPDESVQMCVTSPPYLGLRDYGVDGQVGLEKTPEEYISKMVDIFREVKRVLLGDGTLWLNLGDSYATHGGCKGSRHNHNFRTPEVAEREGIYMKKPYGKQIGLKEKDLVGIPWRVALALQADGWYLRSDIIWHKPNPMPESVTDRPTKAHEYIFLLTKSAKYFYNSKAISEPLQETTKTRYKYGWSGNEDRGYINGPQNHFSKYMGSDMAQKALLRNKRTVWTIPTHPMPDAHFATFPEKLIEPCILAGCPKGGIVLDPFFGSGTTGIVAYKHDRKFLGIELSKIYLDDIAIPRINKASKQLKLW